MKSPFGKLPLRNEEGDLLAVIEVAAGSRNKFKFEPKLGVFALHKLLPLGAAFPYDFGFLPRTQGGDGDPLDVLVLMDEPVPIGTAVPCRLIGILEAAQTEDGTTTRNDRLLAVASVSQRYSATRALSDLESSVLDQLDAFFVFYNRQCGKRYTPLGRGGVNEATTALKAGEKAFKKR